MSSYETAIQYGFKNGFLSTGRMCGGDSDGLSPCIVSQNERNGYFSAKIHPGLLLVGLNTVMLSPRHYMNSTAIDQQLVYLQSTLDYAAGNVLSVLIAMPIPLGENVYDGSSFLEKEYQDMILDTIEHYSFYIVRILVSHTHREEFKILRLRYDEGAILYRHIGQYLTAGLSTSHGNSPSIKVFEMEQYAFWHITKYHTYQLHQKENEISMAKYYDFRSNYCADIVWNYTLDINYCLSQIEFNQTLDSLLGFSFFLFFSFFFISFLLLLCFPILPMAFIFLLLAFLVLLPAFLFVQVFSYFSVELFMVSELF